MSGTRLIKFGGWAFILGAIVFLPGAIAMLFWGTDTIDTSTPAWQFASFAVFLAPICLAVGMLGLRARYSTASPVLLLGAVLGSIVVVVGILGQVFAPVYSVSETYYGVWLIGVLLLYAGLSIFGILALVQKPLPRWNGLPLVAGASLPFIVLLSGIMGGTPSPAMFIVVLVIMTVAQVMLGYLLQADVIEATLLSQREQTA